MINISKPFGESATALLKDRFFRATIKLTAFYVLGTAVILFISSATVLLIFAPPKTESPFLDIDTSVEAEHDDSSPYEIREHLTTVVALVDTTALLIVSIFSYYFARRTLLPIKNVYETQTQFMGDVAHELRTPLSILQAGADTLLKKPRTILEYEEFITDVQEETRRLTRLSNQLLQLLKTENVQGGEIKNVDVSGVCEIELKRFRPYAQERGVTIVVNILPDITLCIEPDCFIQIIQNLIKNAIDYNKQGGVVTVALTEKDIDVILDIADTGIGIPSEKQAKIFERFVKGDTARTQTTSSGAGLGLSIVKALLIKFGGEVILNSTPNVGTNITIRFPKYYS